MHIELHYIEENNTLHATSLSRSRNPDVFLGKVSWKYVSNLQENANVKVRYSARVLCCKFAAYFQNTFSYEHLWTDASACSKLSPLLLFSILKHWGRTSLTRAVPSAMPNMPRCFCNLITARATSLTWENKQL